MSKDAESIYIADPQAKYWLDGLHHVLGDCDRFYTAKRLFHCLELLKAHDLINGSTYSEKKRMLIRRVKNTIYEGA